MSRKTFDTWRIDLTPINYEKDVSKIEKRKGGPVLRKIKYSLERQELLEKFYKILGVTTDNREIFINELDNDPDKKRNILELSSDVRKYFNASNWLVFSKKHVSRPYMSLLKSVLKDMDIEFHPIKKIVKKDGKTFSNNGILIP